MWLPNDEREVIEKFKAKCKELKIPHYSTAFIFREGAKLYVREQQKFLEKAENGEFHAKKRKT